MGLDGKTLFYDLALRASGMVLAVIGWLVMLYLHDVVHSPTRHDITLMDVTFAAVGFLSLSVGCGLMWLGSHINDPATVSARWAQRERRIG